MVLSLGFLYGCEKPGNDEPKSSEKKILTFKLEGVSPVITGVVDETAKTITLTDVPASEGLTALVPTITVSGEATVSPASGTAQNFTNPVTYTVTAEDGTTASYTVTATLGIETLSGTMSSNRTLTDRFQGDATDYVIDGTFYVSGNALLTIDPGVKIRFTGTNGWIVVEDNAGLKMVGTAALPIVLTGPVNNNNKGAWGGVEYHSNRADNLMEYVSIINAGSGNYDAAVDIEADAKLSVKHVNITNSGNAGISVYGQLAAFENNTITGCESVPVYIEHIEMAYKVDETSLLTGNADDFVEIGYGFNNSQTVDLSLKKLSVPYLISNGIYFDKKLTLAAGTTIAFDFDSFFVFENLSTLIANGTATLPIKFTSKDGTEGSWQGIFFNSTMSNSMQYCVVEHGGSYSPEPANIIIGSGSKLSISNSTIKNTTGYGVIRYDAGTISASNNSFSNCDLGNVYNGDEDAVSASL